MPSGTPRLNSIQINGFELQFVVQGEGEPVIFVHGSNSDHRIWNEHLDIISEEYEIIALTQRYFGSADWPDDGEKFCLQTLADDLAAFITASRLQPVTIVGWSLGGGVCLTMAAQHSDLVRKMFLYEPALASFLEDPEEAELAAKDRVSMSADAKNCADVGDYPETVRAFMDGVNAQRGAFDGLSQQLQQVMVDNARMLPLLFAGPPAPAASSAGLKNLHVPITIGLGQYSRPFYRIAATAARQLLPDAKLVGIDGGNHLWPVKDAHSFCKCVMRFLNET
ncbi:MAG: alpha/beta fold hydrolase [Hyphomicrobiaceae bacterium]